MRLVILPINGSICASGNNVHGQRYSTCKTGDHFKQNTLNSAPPVQFKANVAKIGEDTSYQIIGAFQGRIRLATISVPTFNMPIIYCGDRG